MSYRRKPRCGFCRQEGHNRTKCPVLKQKVEDRLAANPNDWWANQQLEMNKPKTKADRTCSYCCEKGHTRRSCETKTADITYMKKYFTEGRQAISDFCKKYPDVVGSGDMFIHEGQEWHGGDYKPFKRPCIVTGVLFDMNHFNPVVTLKSIMPDRYGNLYEGNIELALFINGRVDHNWNFKVTKGKKTGKILEFSDKWLSCSDIDFDSHTLFKGGKTKREKRRGYEIAHIVDNNTAYTLESLEAGLVHE